LQTHLLKPPAGGFFVDPAVLCARLADLAGMQGAPFVLRTAVSSVKDRAARCSYATVAQWDNMA
jgi:hypothetical protein